MAPFVTNLGSRAARLAVALLALVVGLALGAAPAAAREVPLRDVAVVGPDPGLIDVRIDAADFDDATGVLSVSGAVRCNAPDIGVYDIELVATQTHGKRAVAAQPTLRAAGCGPFVVAATAAGWRRGPARVEVRASACGRSCTVEVVGLEVRLRP